MIKLYNDDCLKVMKEMGDNSVDSIITDPPYGLKFMSKKWDYQIPTVEMFQEMLRVAKPGAFLMCFGGSRTFHRMAVNIEDAGWEIRDTIMWLYGSGFPKSYNISKGIDKHFGAEREVVGKRKSNAIDCHKWLGEKYEGHEDNLIDITAPATPEAQTWDGYGTALKPAFEPIIVAMKPVDKNFVNNALTHGVAGLNIDGCRIEGRERTNYGLKNCKRGHGNTYKYTGNADFDSSKGRFPANIILDEEAGKMLDEQSGILKSGAMNGKYSGLGNSDIFKNKVDGAEFKHESSQGGASRFFYCAKASKKERNAGVENNNHPTVKPLKLMEYLCNLTRTPDGGIVLDPFMGSGTTGVACKNLNRDFIGIELDEKYFKICQERLNNYEN